MLVSLSPVAAVGAVEPVAVASGIVVSLRDGSFVDRSLSAGLPAVRFVMPSLVVSVTASLLSFLVWVAVVVVFPDPAGDPLGACPLVDASVALGAGSRPVPVVVTPPRSP